ncbi:MAG: transposase, partial [Proteobacteria bacterium]|nr:transposase [Pseudomonadota bacterium]
MEIIDKQYLKTPWYGSRQLVRHLKRDGYSIGRKRMRRLMKNMGIQSIAP